MRRPMRARISRDLGPNGYLLCNPAPWEGRIDVSDRRYFRLAMEQRQLAIGEYQIGKVGAASGLPGSEQHSMRWFRRCRTAMIGSLPL